MADKWDENEPRCVSLSSSESESEYESVTEEEEIPEPPKATEPETRPTEFPGGAIETPEETMTPEEMEEALKKADAFKLEGNGHFTKGNFIEANFAYSNGIDVVPKKHPTAAILYCNRAACFAHEEEHQKVVDDCTKSIQIDPTYAKAYFRRGTAYHKLKDYKNALPDFKKVDELDPTPPRGLKQTIQQLTPLAEKQQQEETEKMMGELKELGNKFLGLFGLSTDNFKMTPDGKGGHSISFQQNPS